MLVCMYMLDCMGSHAESRPLSEQIKRIVAT